MYSLFWRSPALPYTQKQTPIAVPPGVVVSNAASLRLTGKGAANYGKIQQENLLRLLENFAGNTEPEFPTVGQIWYDTALGVVKVCVATPPLSVSSTADWRSVSGIQVRDEVDGPPGSPSVGDTWFSKTGPFSGRMFVYTGVGRYPQVNWTDTGYYPSANAGTLGIKINTSSFAGAIGSNFGEAYIHGYLAAVPADAAGTILFDSSTISVQQGPLYTRFPGSYFILWDRAGALTSTGGAAHFFSARRLENDTWQYDDNNEWVAFTPNADQTLAIGRINISSLDDNTAPGISSATIWSEARLIDSMLSVPSSLTNGAIGGWAPLFPTVHEVGARREYDYVAGLVESFIGDPTLGGNGAKDRLIDFLTPFNTLDASLRRVVGSTVDPYVISRVYQTDLGALDVDVNSQDWDKLLAAGRWALNRLDLPAGYVTSVSSIPFVIDGLPAASQVLVQSSDPMSTSVDRHVQTRYGTASLLGMYQETVNALRAAMTKRYVLKGMQGQSSTNTSFSSSVASSSQVTFTADANGAIFNTTKTNSLKFRFGGNDTERLRYFTAGQALEMVLTHTPGGSPTSADIDLKTLVDTYGRVRLTFDQVLFMNNAPTPSLTIAPVQTGFSSVTSTLAALGTMTSGGASFTISANLVNERTVQLTVDVLAGGSTTGTFGVQWNYIADGSTYGASLPLYPAPLAYDISDKSGSSVFV